jgi:hypothetical protein
MVIGLLLFFQCVDGCGGWDAFSVTTLMAAMA